MAELTTSATISEGWVNGLQSLLSGEGKAVHVMVAIAAPAEVPEVRAALDAFVHDQRPKQRERGNHLFSPDTVANTLFPAAFYRPSGEDARHRLYQLHAEAQTVHGRRRQSESYFDRLVRWPGRDGEVNQLEALVQRLQAEIGRRGPKSSAYEAGIAGPDDGEVLAAGQDGGDLRVQAPGLDPCYIGFPCLSHVSVTLHGGAIHLCALYRNQHFISRVYGNYLGLARIGQFVATEVGCELGEIACVATHADAEIGTFGRRTLDELLATCEEACEGRAAVDAHG
jgi:hypothetical protein